MRLTVQDINRVVDHLKKKHVNKDYVLRIPKENAHLAYKLGLSPFCPLTDDNFIEAEVTKT